jgi:hypothetical protein
MPYRSISVSSKIIIINFRSESKRVYYMGFLLLYEIFSYRFTCRSSGILFMPYVVGDNTNNGKNGKCVKKSPFVKGDSLLRYEAGRLR